MSDSKYQPVNQFSDATGPVFAYQTPALFWIARQPYPAAWTVEQLANPIPGGNFTSEQPIKTDDK